MKKSIFFVATFLSCVDVSECSEVTSSMTGFLNSSNFSCIPFQQLKTSLNITNNKYYIGVSDIVGHWRNNVNPGETYVAAVGRLLDEKVKGAGAYNNLRGALLTALTGYLAGVDGKGAYEAVAGPAQVGTENLGRPDDNRLVVNPPVANQLAPNQLAPNQVAPNQVAPNQLVPNQLVPKRLVPNQLAPKPPAPKVKQATQNPPTTNVNQTQNLLVLNQAQNQNERPGVDPFVVTDADRSNGDALSRFLKFRLYSHDTSKNVRAGEISRTIARYSGVLNGFREDMRRDMVGPESVWKDNPGLLASAKSMEGIAVGQKLPAEVLKCYSLCMNLINMAFRSCFLTKKWDAYSDAATFRQKFLCPLLYLYRFGVKFGVDPFPPVTDFGDFVSKNEGGSVYEYCGVVLKVFTNDVGVSGQRGRERECAAYSRLSKNFLMKMLGCDSAAAYALFKEAVE
ncbi:MAG: hypothetical protein LBB63_03255 [Holosporaceae bacterium]|nr:hypothetical protein [Holosporaceae bacterium]